MSRPLWARELKLRLASASSLFIASRPLWARELKLIARKIRREGTSRAPCGRVN